MSKFNGKKTNNQNKKVKKELREYLCGGNISCLSVLEVFCGDGQMYKEVWKLSKRYTGIDKVKFFDDRHTICGDAEKITSNINFFEYDVFDIDAYGSPYNVLYNLLPGIKRANKKQVYFAITDGTNMDLKMGRISRGLRKIIGINTRIIKNAHIMHNQLIAEVVDSVASYLGGHVQQFKLAHVKSGSAVRYYVFSILVNDVAESLTD